MSLLLAPKATSTGCAKTSLPEPAMELSLSRSLPGSEFFVVFFCSISKTRFFARPALRPGRRAVNWPLHQTLRRAPPLSGDTLTPSRATARLRGRDNDQRGARYRARFNRATTLYPVGPRTRTMMQSCASERAPKRRTHSSSRHESQGACRGSATSNRHRRSVTSVRTRPKLSGMPSTFSVYCAGRITTPSGTTPSRTSRHRAIRSLRAKATIKGFRYASVLGAGSKPFRQGAVLLV